MAEEDTDPPLPTELAAALRGDPDAHARWRALPRGERWFRIGPIIEAKRPETKVRRAEAIVASLQPAEVAKAKAAAAERRRAPKPPKPAGAPPTTAELSARFVELIVDVVGSDLRSAGFRPRAKGRHWRRVRGEQADLIGFDAFRNVAPDEAHLVLGSGIYLPALDQAEFGAAWEPSKAPTPAASGVAPREPAGLDLGHAWLDATTDWDAVGERMREEVLLALEQIEAVGVVTRDRVRTVVEQHWPARRFAVLLLEGDLEGAAADLRRAAEEIAARGDDPRTHPYVISRAPRCGLDLGDLPEPSVLRPTAEVAADLRRSFGDRLVHLQAGDRHIKAVLVQPTHEELATARGLAGGTGLTLVALPLEPDEVRARRPTLERVLAERERNRGDLVAWVGDFSVPITHMLLVHAMNLDRATARAVHEVLPPECVAFALAHRTPANAHQFLAKADRIAAPHDAGR